MSNHTPSSFEARVEHYWYRSGGADRGVLAQIVAKEMAQEAMLAEQRAIEAEQRDIRRAALALKCELLALKAGFDPGQPRDEEGKWAEAGAEEDGGALSGEGGSDGASFFGEAPDGTLVEGAGGGAFSTDQKNMTVQSFRSAYCLGGIQSVLPGQFEFMTIAEVMVQAKNGDASARRCLKLLSRPEYRK